MQKKHKIFIIQIAIAAALFVVSSFVLLTVFHKDPKSKSYLSVNEGVKEMASNTYALIDTLIARNDLTFDPTSGKMLDKVMGNLKYTKKGKFLMIGSSQMRVVQGQKIQGHVKSVSRKIVDYTEDIQTYNLSLGGMTTPEKIIVGLKTLETIQPDRVLISVTPWDCLSDKIRPEVKAIENKKYSINENVTEEVSENVQPESDEVFPLSFNSKITNTLDHIVEENIGIYRKRSAIQKWLGDKTVKTLVGIKDNLEAEEIVKSNIPEYWRTLNQDLDNTSGWVSDVVYKGERAVKIVNTTGVRSKWLGDDITLEKPTATFEFEGWSKAENVSNSTKLYCLDFQVIFEDGTTQWFYKGLRFKKGTHDWQKVSTKVTFDKKVKAIKPHILFYNGTGTTWFDNIKAIPIYEDGKGDNLLPNFGFEKELKERLNVSYSYTQAEWERIKENIFSIVDFLASQKTPKKNVLLFTPFWHTEQKTAYPQKAQYKELVQKVQQYCNEKNIILVDASYILTKDNFGVYKNGSVRDKIDVLHFNADAHDKLAKHIIKELNL